MGVEEPEDVVVRQRAPDVAGAALDLGRGPERVRDGLLGRVHDCLEDVVQRRVRERSGRGSAAFRSRRRREGEEDLAAPVVSDGAGAGEPEAGAARDPLELSRGERRADGDDDDAAPRLSP